MSAPCATRAPPRLRACVVPCINSPPPPIDCPRARLPAHLSRPTGQKGGRGASQAVAAAGQTQCEGARGTRARSLGGLIGRARRAPWPSRCCGRGRGERLHHRSVHHHGGYVATLVPAKQILTDRCTTCAWMIHRRGCCCTYAGACPIVDRILTNAQLVIDNGSGMCKAGFAGDDAPRAVFPYVQCWLTVQVDRRSPPSHGCDGRHGPKGLVRR